MKRSFKRAAAVLSAAVIAGAWCATAAAEAVYLPEDSPLNRFSSPAAAFAVPELKKIGGQSGGEYGLTAPYAPYKSASESSSDLPASFDMRTEGTITGIKDQGQYGTCWAHSAAACAESSLIGRVPGIDLSELHTAYMSYTGEYAVPHAEGETVGDILDAGAMAGVTANLWAQWSGPIMEDKLPYDRIDILEDAEKTEALRYEADFHLENAYMFDYDAERSNCGEVNSQIKQFVYDGLAVEASFYSNTSKNYSYVYCSSYTRKPPRFANHMITIIGWDDSFPKENFKNEPEHDGAWLVKNSWGISSGKDGCIWISYDDMSIGEFCVYELGSADNYAEIFQHDNCIPFQIMSGNDPSDDPEPSYMANVFTAGSSMQIEAVSTYIMTPGTSYDVTVYTDLTDPAVPTSGKPSGVSSGTCDMTGYMTLELDEDVYVDAGSSFGVMVKLYCADNPYVIPLEGCYTVNDTESGEVLYSLGAYEDYDTVSAHTAPGESFYSGDGVSWEDVADFSYTLTDEEKDALLQSVEDQLFDGLEPEDTEELANAENALQLYRTMFSAGDLEMVIGNISLKAFGNPVNTVDFSHISGEIHAGERVELSVKDGSDIYVSVNGSEYELYSAPIEVTEKMTVSATTDFSTFTQRTFTPARSGFNVLSYRMYPNMVNGSNGQRIYSNPVYGKAKRVGENEYRIDIGPSDYCVDLYPETAADITMDGVPIKAYTYTDHIAPENYGDVITITFELTGTSDPDSTVTLTVVKSPATIDLENETIDYQGVAAYAPDGTKIPQGGSVGEYAGQTITVRLDQTNVSVEVPQRAVLPDLEFDYYSETLGFIPKDDTGRLLILTEGSADYVSAAPRLIDGKFINSGMTMNYAVRVIPGETLSLKIAAGEDEFASLPLTVNVPAAPELPEITPEIMVIADGLEMIGFDFEIMALSGGGTDIAELAKMYAFSDDEVFGVLAAAMFGTDDTKYLSALLGGEFGSTASDSEGLYAVRYAATDTAFASKVTIMTLSGGVLVGDVNNDGMVDGVDASLILVHNANATNGEPSPIEEKFLSRADYNGDGLIDPIDASLILIYNANNS